MVMVRRSLPFRVLCLLLIACVLCFSCLMPYAQAVVVESAVLYGAYELIAAMLIGGGVVYATSDDARSAAAQVYDWLASNASAALEKINFWVAQAIVGGVSTGIRVSKDIWDMIASAFNDLFSSDSLEFGREYVALDMQSLAELQQVLYQSGQIYNDGLKGDVAFTNVKAINYVGSSGSKVSISLGIARDGSVSRVYLYRDGYDAYELVNYRGFSLPDFGFWFDDTPTYGDQLRFGYWVSGFSDTTGEDFIRYDFMPNITNVHCYFGTYTFSGDSVAPDLVFPSDNSLVRVPDLPDVQTDEDGKEVVVYPDLSLNPTDHLADIPKQETGDQVDVPYDTLVDVGTGEAVGEGEGVENPDIPTEGTDTGLIQNILDKITNFFDSPSDFKLDFDGFKNLILPDRFPFCIPFDLINSVRVFAASAANFSFDIDLETSYFSVHHTVDLSPFAVPIAFFRYTCVLFWIWVLITRTRDLMKW